jgi:hypothetical protein
MAANLLILGGNWLRFVGAKLELFDVVMTGQMLIGMAQPFVLATPTRFSNLWFTDKGRTTATAIASPANPFGGALGQLLAPIWVPTGATKKIPDMVLYVAIIVSMLCSFISLLLTKSVIHWCHSIILHSRSSAYSTICFCFKAENSTYTVTFNSHGPIVVSISYSYRLPSMSASSMPFHL